ncbi:MAG: M48 family metallopeptidase [Candidatus Paceibacterota bacterium]
MSESLTYTIRRVRRAKRMRIIIHQDGTVVVTKPWWARKKTAEAFLLKNQEWVLEKVRAITTGADPDLTSTDEHHYEEHKEAARALVHAKLEQWNRLYAFTYHRVSIRNQKTRWGSCSASGNLNFSYKILFLPERLQDYLVVHELCHLKEMNHSQRFWALVGQALPGYRTLYKELHLQGDTVDQE